MKAKYEAPKMEVINIEMDSSLLVGSPEKTGFKKKGDDILQLDDSDEGFNL